MLYAANVTKGELDGRFVEERPTAFLVWNDDDERGVTLVARYGEAPAGFYYFHFDPREALKLAMRLVIGSLKYSARQRLK
jgi:hypothetical protein